MTSLRLHRARARARHGLVQCDGPRTARGHAEGLVAAIARHLGATGDLLSIRLKLSTLHRASGHTRVRRNEWRTAFEARPWLHAFAFVPVGHVARRRAVDARVAFHPLKTTTAPTARVGDSLRVVVLGVTTVTEDLYVRLIKQKLHREKRKRIHDVVSGQSVRSPAPLAPCAPLPDQTLHEVPPSMVQVPAHATLRRRGRSKEALSATRLARASHRAKLPSKRHVRGRTPKHETALGARRAGRVQRTRIGVASGRAVPLPPRRRSPAVSALFMFRSHATKDSDCSNRWEA